MRSLIVLAIIGLAVWYFTIGIRIGLLTDWPTQIFNGNGTNTYTKDIVYDKYALTVIGTCTTSSGKATISVTSPQGRTLASVQCTKGKQNVNIKLVPGLGKFPLIVKMEKFTGNIDVH
jgi:hypothetical protein